MLGQLQADEKQLVQMQELLNRNLDVLAGAGTFEQAVHSLTAAIHLMTLHAGNKHSDHLPLRRPGAAA